MISKHKMLPGDKRLYKQPPVSCVASGCALQFASKEEMQARYVVPVAVRFSRQPKGSPHTLTHMTRSKQKQKKHKKKKKHKKH
jgi:hypothetical protein